MKVATSSSQNNEEKEEPQGDTIRLLESIALLFDWVGVVDQGRSNCHYIRGTAELTWLML